jgi:hypothetical protein
MALRMPGSDTFAGRTPSVPWHVTSRGLQLYSLQPLGVALEDRSASVGISDRMRAARVLEPTSTALSTDLAWLYPPNVDLHTTDRLV